MMDCKRALTESGGDMEGAVEYLRKKGLAVAEKRKGRTTKEGLIRIAVSGSAAAMVEVNCETDFVARNEEFESFATALAQHALTAAPASLDALLASEFQATTVQEVLTSLLGKIGENMLVSRFRHIALSGPGVIETYLHAGGRVGVLVALATPTAEAAGNAKAREIAHELALHVAFANPICVERSAVPAEVIERERRIARERAIEQGKPANIVDKIVDGQLNKFYQEAVLLDQLYIKDDKSSVKKWMDAEAKALGGGGVQIADFARFGLGEMAKDNGDEAAAS
jgi:elongation factor Ts